MMSCSLIRNFQSSAMISFTAWLWIATRMFTSNARNHPGNYQSLDENQKMTRHNRANALPELGVAEPSAELTELLRA
jgi:hypothetical protein